MNYDNTLDYAPRGSFPKRSERQRRTRQRRKHRKGPNFMRLFSILGSAVFYMLLSVMALMVFFIFQARATGDVPSVFGHQLYIVLGGSMSPAFEAGSLVIVQPVDPTEVRQGDIITYQSSSRSKVYTTHRVTGVVGSAASLGFTTRGDANRAEDPGTVSASALRGRAVASIPYAGLLFSFIRSRHGLLLTIIVPGLLIIIVEMLKISRILSSIENKGSRKPEKRHIRSDLKPT